ncbi:MAG: hypothetical protein K6T34_10210 [Thermoflavifilum sp.]|nr:hypothetical protein [Thermoflavifilum sp.]
MSSTPLYFCTLFDSRYLTRGLVMYESLKASCQNFHLYIFSFDDRSYHMLEKLHLDRVTVIPLSSFEDEDLLRVKPTRTPAEYCWTSTPSTILYCIEKFNLPHCTYLDADLYFYNDPIVCFQEMGDHSILITEHRYSPQYEKSQIAGKYCVQFITFKNDVYGLRALKWWRERCLEWCYARIEDGKFGDQKYLDDWPERFEKVWVLQHPGGGLAPWNIQQYEVKRQGEKLICTDKRTGHIFEPIFYHFHYLRFFQNGYIELGRRTLSEDVLRLFYKPHISRLEDMKQKLWSIDSSFDPHGATASPRGLKHVLVSAYRRFRNIYHVYPLQEFLEKYA